MILQKIFAYMDFNSLVLLIFLLFLTDVIRNWKPRNFPPGPWAMPFVGNIFTGVDFKTIEKVRCNLQEQRQRTSREQHLRDENNAGPQDENRLLCLSEFAVQLSQKYGPVFSLRRGNERMVYITGYKMVKDALVNRLDSFAERPIVPLFHVVFKGLGGFKRAYTCFHSAFLWSVSANP